MLEVVDFVEQLGDRLLDEMGKPGAKYDHLPRFPLEFPVLFSPGFLEEIVHHVSIPSISSSDH